MMAITLLVSICFLHRTVSHTRDFGLKYSLILKGQTVPTYVYMYIPMLLMQTLIVAV